MVLDLESLERERERFITCDRAGQLLNILDSQKSQGKSILFVLIKQVLHGDYW